MKLKVKKLTKTANLPTRANLNDVGYDLYVDSFKDLGDKIKVNTGIAIEPEEGWYFELASRSSIHKSFLSLCNGIGIIDNSYRGELIGMFYKMPNFTSIKVGDRLLQIIPHRYVELEIEEAEELSDTPRGTCGFGSSGV